VSTNSMLQKVASFLDRLTAAESSTIEAVIPTHYDVLRAQTTPLPLALRPRLPWLRVSVIMMNGLFLAIAAAYVVAFQFDSQDIDRYPPLLEPMHIPFNPFFIPFGSIPPVFLLAFIVQVLIALFFLVGMPLILYHVRPKITVSAEGITVVRIGKHRFVRWDEITEWRLLAVGTLEVRVITPRRTLVWREFPAYGISRSLAPRREGRGTKGYIERARLLHAVIVAHTDKDPLTIKQLMSRQQGLRWQ
jgi:hypothetical protein